jgi:hypothetical protein
MNSGGLLHARAELEEQLRTLLLDGAVAGVASRKRGYVALPGVYYRYMSYYCTQVSLLDEYGPFSTNERQVLISCVARR